MEQQLVKHVTRCYLVGTIGCTMIGLAPTSSIDRDRTTRRRTWLVNQLAVAATTDSSRLFTIKITIEVKRIERWVSSIELIVRAKQFHRTFMRSLLSLPLVETLREKVTDRIIIPTYETKETKCFSLKRSYEFEKKFHD